VKLEFLAVTKNQRHFCQRGDDVFGDPVCEIFLIGIAAFVEKRQDGDRGLLGQSQNRALGPVERGRALHPDEPITAARNSHNVALATIAVQRLAQIRDMDVQVVLFDRAPRPQTMHQLVFADNRALRSGEHAQDIESAAREPDRLVLA
jgi:hypothetical protein